MIGTTTIRGATNFGFGGYTSPVTTASPVTTVATPATTYASAARPVTTTTAAAPVSTVATVAPTQAVVAAPSIPVASQVEVKDTLDIEGEQVEENKKRITTMEIEGSIKEARIKLELARLNLRKFELNNVKLAQKAMGKADPKDKIE